MKKIKSALISVFNKDGLEPIVRLLSENDVMIYSTGGTEAYIKSLGVDVISVEEITDYPSILGGRVKTLHPKVFGGILNRREVQQDQNEVREFQIPLIDLVILDLYPFTETWNNKNSTHEDIIEKIDIGGVSLIRAAAKNYKDVAIVSNVNQYSEIYDLLSNQDCQLSESQRMKLATFAFENTYSYDETISTYFFTTKIKEKSEI